jgi:hypothetical protein
VRAADYAFFPHYRAAAAAAECAAQFALATASNLDID